MPVPRVTEICLTGLGRDCLEGGYRWSMFPRVPLAPPGVSIKNYLGVSLEGNVLFEYTLYFSNYRARTNLSKDV